MLSPEMLFLFIMMFLVVIVAGTSGQKLTEKTEKLEAIKKTIDEVGPTTAVYRIRKLLEATG